MRKTSTRISICLIACLLVMMNSAFAQVAISSGNTVTQNFDAIGTAAVSTLPSGWKVDKQASARILGNYATAVSATERQGGANVSATAANGIYNFGSGTTTIGGADRAIGGISSGSASGTVNVYVDLLNNGSLTIPGLTLSYDVEKYRGGTNAAGFRMQLFYSTDGIAWTNAGTDFLTAFAADASNAGYATAPGVSVSITSKLLPVSVAPNAHLYLAWSYAVSSGSTTSNAQGLSVDNISVIAATGVAPAPAITLASALPAFGSVKVGSGGSVKSFAISGSDLDGSAISVTALPGFSYSETGVSGTFTSTLNVTAGTSFTNKIIYVQFDPTAAQSYNGSIVVSGGNAANLFVPVTGSGNNISPVVISAQPLLRYTENFSDINNWSNNFNSGIGATRFSGVEVSGTSSASNPTNDNPTLVTTSSTTFVSGSAGGVQKASGAIQLISTGSTDNRSSVAVDFYMDFTGVNAGTLSFDWSVVNNSFAPGDSRTGSLQVYATTDGISFTRINAADVLNFVNGVPATGTVSSIQLPSFFNGSATARLRFFYYNGTGGASGSRPKISIDNLTVSGVANTPCATPTATPTSLTFGTITETTIQGNFIAASPSVNEYLVIMSSNSTLTSNPIDGVTYTVGDNIGDGDVISKGLDLNFTATGLTGATTYYFFVFPVNSVCTGGPKYLTTNVLTDDATTVAGLPPCAAPATQAADLVTSASINSIQGSFTATAADEYLVLQSTSAFLSNTPVNGVAYSVGAILGNATVIQKTAATSFTVASLNPATQYYYFVFSVNSQNCVNGPVYNTVSPLSGSETTLPLPACTTPVSQPGSLSFNTSNNSITGTFNATGSGYNYLVVISNSSTLSATPSDNTDYAAGASLGGGTVISNNTTTSFIANNLSNSTTYFFFVFAANKNCTGGTKYLVASPLTGTATTTNAPVYNYYYGTLHSHSDYSDGNKDNPGFTPANNYAYADQSNGMDFLGISEHNHFSSLDNPGNELANYKLGLAQAAAYNAAHPGFLALYGMEWGVISGGGHVIVFGDGMNDLFGWESNVNGKVGPNYDVYVPKSTYLGTEGLFKTITNYAVNNAFATLAHPSNNDYNNLSNIAYDPIADEAISGTAVESGPATSTNTTYSNPGSSMFYLWYYQKLLSKGYHLGPTIDHDNHNTTFGRTTGARTAVLAPSLSQTDIIKSIKDMHFYATEDVDAKVDFTINTRIMGSIFEDRNAPSISVNFTDPTNSTSNALIRVLYGKPGSGILPVVVDSVFASSLNYVDNNLANNETGYYYVDITNGTSRIVTSPIWYTRKCASTSELSVSACDSYTWFGTVYTTSTTVSKVLTTTGGCDSTITLHLTINSSPSAATIALVGSDNGCPGTGVALTATAASTNTISAYQWLLNGIPVATTAVSNFIAFTSGSYAVTVTDINSCSVTSAGSISVTVADNIAPVADVSILPVITAQCSATITTLPTATDNCAGTITATTTDALVYNEQGTYTIHWTYADGNGNTTLQEQTVIIKDDIAPVPNVAALPVITAACSATVTAPTALDNCVGNITATTTDPVTYTTQGTFTIHWSYQDGHGNTATQNQTVIIQDVTAPVITKGADISVTNDAGTCGAVVLITAATSTDACGVTTTIGVRSDAVSLSALYPVGITTITWTATDIHGNTSSAIQTITVTDTEKPTITAPMAYSVVNNPGECKATLPSIGTPVVNDNCGVTSVTNDHPSSNYPVGTTIVTWMVTDIHGNVTDTAKQTITVMDNELPAITVNNVIVSSASGTCGATIILTTPVVSDNCGVASVTNNHPDTYYPVGTTLVTWTVTDNNGWTKTAIQSITVTDNTAPVISPLANQRFCLSGDGNYTIPVVTAEDNCSIASYSYSITGATIRNGNTNNASGLFSTGISTIIWTVTDASGNISVSSTIVTVDVLPSAVIVASTPDAFCNTVTLTASSAGVGSTYSWSTGSSSQSISLGQTSGDGVYSVTVTSNGCSSAPASYTFTKQTLVSSYTLLAFDEITLGENNKVNSGSVGVTSLKGEVSFRKNSSVSSPGSFVKAKKIDKNGSNIVISNPIYSAATGIALPTMFLNTASTHNLPNKDVSQNSVTTVNGNYKNLTLKKGSRTTVTGTVFGSIKVEQGAQVTFTAATISIDKLEVVKGPRYGYSYVRFAGDTKLLVSSSVSIGSQVYINPDNYKVTFYLGDKKSDDERFSVKGGDTKVTANIYVPNGKLKVTGGYSYGDYGNGRGDCDRDDDDDRYYGQGNNYVNMTGLFIADEIEGNGKNVIWNSFVCGSAAVPVLNATQVITQTLTEEKGTISTEAELKVTVLPNPSTTYFTLKLESRYNTAVNMRVTDSHGRVVDAKTGIGANSTLQVGHSYAAGIYFAEMIQGGVRKTVQLIKLR